MIRECLTDARDAALVLSDSCSVPGNYSSVPGGSCSVPGDSVAGFPSIAGFPFITELNAAIARLHPYKIGKKGNLQEWFYDWEDEDPHHRHQSHLFGIYPGHHLDDGTNTKEALHRAASRTLELNPLHLCNNGDRIIRKDQDGQAKAMIYLRTKDANDTEQTEFIPDEEPF